MIIALVVAGQFSGLHSASNAALRNTRIHPSAVDYARAVEQGLTYPATTLQRDAAMASARREAAALMAGFAGTVTTVVVADVVEEASTVLVDELDTGLPQSITQADARIERPVLRSKTGEAIAVAPSVAALTSVARAPGSTTMVALADSAAIGPASEIKAVMVELAEEAHSRNGRPAMTAQAMSEYLSLYALRERVASVGRALASETPDRAGGVWVANLGDGMDDALFQNGFSFGQHSFGAIAGIDGAAQNIFSDGDTLVFGGFASAFGTMADETISLAPAETDLRGGALGVFAVFDDGPFSVSGMMRAELSQTFDAFAPNRLDVSSAMQVLKAEVVARYRFDVLDWAVEPSAGVTFASGRREIVGLSPVSPQMQEAESLRFQVGVRASGVVYNRSGTSVEPSVTITIAEELRGNGDVAFLGGAPNAAAEPVNGKTIGSVSIGVDVKDDSGWVGFVRADGQVSDEDKPSAGVSAGVKTQW